MLKEKSERNNSVFLVVKHGCICQESKEYREGWRETEVYNPSTKETQIKWIRPYDSVSGHIDKVEWYSRSDEKSGKTFSGYSLVLVDGEESAVLDLPFGSIPYQIFTKIAENISYGEPVEFAAWHDRKKDKLAFGAKQGDKWIKHRYTVADPGECPPPVQHGVTGKWDFSAQEVWLKERIDAEVVPVVEQWAAYRAANAPKVEAAPAPAPAPTEERRAAFEAQAPRPQPAPAAPKPQGPPRAQAAPARPAPPPPPSDPYEGGQFDDSVPF